MSKLTPMEKIAIMYNGKYDLSKAIYVNTSTKIEIICPVHGSFFKTTKDALTNKAGCQKCAHEERADTKSRFKTKQEVYDFCSELHNNKFTYIDLIQKSPNRITTTDFLIIKCSIHGEFKQSLNSHISKQSGCTKCAHAEKGLSCRKTQDQFINEATIINNGKYTYDNVVYVNSTTHVKVTCKTHGDFEVIAYCHVLLKSGCPKCKAKEASIRSMKTTEQFIRDSESRFGNLYDYSKVDYKGSKEKVEIICVKHGSFYQTPNDHLHQLAGCTKCSASGPENRIMHILDTNNIKYVYQYVNKHCGPQKQSPLRFDFFLPDVNIMLEYDGPHHFKPIQFHPSVNKDEAFSKVVKHDKIKDHFCTDNGIKMLRIPYWEMNNMESIIKNYINDASM